MHERHPSTCEQTNFAIIPQKVALTDDWNATFPFTPLQMATGFSVQNSRVLVEIYHLVSEVHPLVGPLSRIVSMCAQLPSPLSANAVSARKDSRRHE